MTKQYEFMPPTRFSPDFPLPKQIHVGQNDWVNFRRAAGPAEVPHAS